MNAQQAFINIETTLGKQATLAEQSKRIGRRLKVTYCDDCRRSLKRRQAVINGQLDAVNSKLLLLIRQLNAKPSRKGKWN